MYLTPQSARRGIFAFENLLPQGQWWQMSGTGASAEEIPLQIASGLAVTLWLKGANVHNTCANPVIEAWMQQALCRNTQSVVEKDTLVSPAQSVELLRSAFGLNIKQLAQVLQVERVTVYDWLRKATWNRLQPASRSRLMNMATIAQEWAGLQPLPPGFLLEPLDESGEHVFHLLTQEGTQPQEIAAAHAQLLRNKSIAQRAREFEAAKSATAVRVLDNAIANAKLLGID